MSIGDGIVGYQQTPCKQEKGGIKNEENKQMADGVCVCVIFFNRML